MKSTAADAYGHFILFFVTIESILITIIYLWPPLESYTSPTVGVRIHLTP